MQIDYYCFYYRIKTDYFPCCSQYSLRLTALEDSSSIHLSCCFMPLNKLLLSSYFNQLEIYCVNFSELYLCINFYSFHSHFSSIGCFKVILFINFLIHVDSTSCQSLLCFSYQRGFSFLKKGPIFKEIGIDQSSFCLLIMDFRLKIYSYLCQIHGLILFSLYPFHYFVSSIQSQLFEFFQS